MSADRQDYERVRAQLIERGYLGGRVERFVLRRPSLWGSAARAAALGSPLLAALLAAIVARGQVGPLRAGDLVLMWLYFVPVAAAALFLLDAAVGWLGGVLARRFGVRGGEATRAALLAALPTAAYLFALGAGGSLRRAGPGSELAFFLLAVITMVCVSWLAGLVSVASTLKRTGTVARRTSGRVALLVVGVAAAALLSGWRAARDTAPAHDDDWPSVERREAPPLLVVAVDGLGGEWVERLQPSGAVEGLLATLERGTVIPLQSAPGAPPPEVWTTMMTGVGPERHGVREVGGKRPAGMRATLQSESGPLPLAAALRALLPGKTVPVSGAARRVRTAWEIVGRTGDALAVGWWGSWPAGPDGPRGAWVVSERALGTLLAGRASDRDTWPEALFAREAARFETLRAELRARFERVVPAGAGGEAAERMWESFLIDAFALEVTRELWSSTPLDAAFVYLPGLDILRARMERDAAGADIVVSAAMLEAYTRWVDGRVAALGSWPRAAETRLVLLGHPGRAADPGAEGFAAIVGSGVPAGCIEPVADAKGIASLVEWLAGLPASLDAHRYVPGSCLAATIDTSRTIASYGLRTVEARSEPGLHDDETVRRLRSLGYLN